MFLLPIMAAAIGLSGQHIPADQNPINVLGNRRVYGPPFISPMGEPFRQKSPQDKPLADWFQQADRNHDGYLTIDEMVDDSDRFFAILDSNHDGTIDPEEIDYYEQVIAPEIGGEPNALRGDPMPSIDANDVPENSGKYATRITSGGGHDRSADGTGQFALFDTIEPVTSADTDFNGRVTLEEFRAAAKRRFNLLDQSQTRRLSLAQLQR
jgi:hypothetical protein